jgi:hypothetical protein
MSGICALMGFNALMQQAVKLIRGLDISTADGNVCVGVCSVISWFKVSAYRAALRTPHANVARPAPAPQRCTTATHHNTAQLNERHRMDGLEAKNNRRDLRGGACVCACERRAASTRAARVCVACDRAACCLPASLRGC